MAETKTTKKAAAKKADAKTIGLGIESPKDIQQADNHCPFTSDIRVRGNIMKGVVVTTGAPLTATVKVTRKVFVPKYRRYKNVFSKTTVHNPASINAQVGDIVEFVGTRPISKTKSSVIVKVVEAAQ